ncbi:MAG: DUF4410 domain-containing protein [Pseudomonadota bacterium]
MKLLGRIILASFALTLLAGCASTNVISRQAYTGGKIARPGHIYVYDFAPESRDMPAEQSATEGQVGAKIAQVLVEEIRGMGLPAERANDRTMPQIGDLVIRGSILSMDEGSATKRVGLGFGSGASELKTKAEGFLMTDHGLRKLGSGISDAGGSKSPGTALGVAGAIATANPAGLIVSSVSKLHGEASGSSTVEGRAEDTAKEIAKELQKKFKEQGWI